MNVESTMMKHMLRNAGNLRLCYRISDIATYFVYLGLSRGGDCFGAARRDEDDGSRNCSNCPLHQASMYLFTSLLLMTIRRGVLLP